MKLDDKELAASMASQDQEWAEACTWIRRANKLGVLIITEASCADDPQDLTRLMAKSNDIAEIVQRMVALVLCEAALRNVSRENGQ